MSGEIPERRSRPLRTMEDMGMRMEGMKSEGTAPSDGVSSVNHEGHVRQMEHRYDGSERQPMAGEQAGRGRVSVTAGEPVEHDPNDHGSGNQMIAEYSRNRLAEPGRGLENSGRRVLVYADLKSLMPAQDQREPERDIEIHLTGHMNRYMWSFDGKKYSEAREPIRFRYGERLRLRFVNDTMMEHPLHLHGMWMYLENSSSEYLPRKHTVIVKPAERLSVTITADAPGRWAFHCHLLLHMDAGMFRVVEVADNEHGGHS